MSPATLAAPIHTAPLSAIPPWRRRLYRLFFVVVGPLLLLAAGEIAVRLLVPFPPTTFFVEQDIGGQRWVLDNPYFGYTFLKPKQSREPAQNLFPVVKPAGTTRILVLGESAAMGFPHPEFGLARTLKAVLQDAAPTNRFEMIDGSMTMINSHIIREIAHQGLRYQPDAVVLYIGNNEVIGPYGPTKVFQYFYPSASWVRIDRWVRNHSYLLRWLSQNVMARHVSAWRGLDHFRGHPIAANDPKLQTMRAEFRQNLRAILTEVRRRGIPIYVAATAVNLDAWPPLYSFVPDHLAPDVRRDWEAQVDVARKAMADQRWSTALDAWQAAERLAPDHAETVYGLARCHEALGHSDEAHRLYERACELDGYRFRSDAPIAEIVASEVKALQDPGIHLFDARSQLSWRREGAEPVFLEHVHFTVSGLYALAELFARELLNNHALAVSQDRVMAALFMQPDIAEEAWSAVRQFLDMEVFRDQPGYAERIRDVTRRRDEASRLVESVTLPQLQQAYSNALASASRDWRTDLLFGEYLSRRGLYSAALAPLERAAAAKPNKAEIHLLLGQIRYQNADYLGATRSIEKAIELNPYLPEAWNYLGLTWYIRGSRENARADYERALDLDPNNPGAQNNLGYLEYEKGQYEAAIALFKSALSRTPNLIEAKYHLGLSLLALAKLEDAALTMGEVVQQNPKLAKAWSAWGVVLMKQGKTEEAAQKFERAIQEQPDLIEAQINLVYVYLAQGHPGKAIPSLASVLEKRPDSPEPHYLYGLALNRVGRFDEAIPHLKQAIQGASHRTDWMTETAALFIQNREKHPELLSDARDYAERTMIITRGASVQADKILKVLNKLNQSTNSLDVSPSVLNQPSDLIESILGHTNAK